MKLNKIYIFILITFVLLGIILSTSNIYAGGGPQLVCKDMAQKQGWLIDDTKFDEELSNNACILRNPTIEEKDKILEFCKTEEKGEFRTDCLDKCIKYYSDITFRECNKNEVTSIKSEIYKSNIKNLLKTQTSLQQAIIVSLVVFTFFCSVVLLVKKIRKNLKTRANN
jgi:hypothetical protein